MKQYENMPEENKGELKRLEKEHNRRLLDLEVVIGAISAAAFLALIFAAAYAEMSTRTRILLICIGAAIFAAGMYHCLKIEHDAGYYECRNCKARYIPEMKKLIWSPHIGRSRRMKCPYCGNTNYHKKTLTK